MASPCLYIDFAIKNKGEAMKKKASHILEKMREFLWSDEFADRYRNRPNAFVRNRVFSIQITVLFILNLLNKSIAIELLNFTHYLINPVSRTAVSKARSKLDPSAFQGLNQVFVEEFYRDNQTLDFHGFTLAAIDGTTLELPINSFEILAKYGAASNHTDREIPMARSSSVFDVLNGTTVDAIIGSYHTSERDLTMQHIENISRLNLDKRLLLMLDRGYPSIELILFLILSGVNFVMRVNKQFLKESNKAFKKTHKKDFTFDIKASRAKQAFRLLKEKFPHLNKNDLFRIRGLVIPLETGEDEVLITTLLDKKEYGRKIFKELYFSRWGIEEEYKFKKSKIEIENFSGLSCNIVEQDFHASILAGNIHAVLALESMEELKEEQPVETTKYEYKINKNVGLATLKHALIKVLFHPTASIPRFCEEIKMDMKRNLVPIRPGRNHPRIRQHPNRKYHMNTR